MKKKTKSSTILVLWMVCNELKEPKKYEMECHTEKDVDAYKGIIKSSKYECLHDNDGHRYYITKQAANAYANSLQV